MSEHSLLLCHHPSSLSPPSYSSHHASSVTWDTREKMRNMNLALISSVWLRKVGPVRPDHSGLRWGGKVMETGSGLRMGEGERELERARGVSGELTST